MSNNKVNSSTNANAMMDFLSGKFKCQSDDELINSASSMGENSEDDGQIFPSIQSKELIE